MTPQNAHILIPGTCDCVTLKRTGKLAVRPGLVLMFLALKIGQGALQACRQLQKVEKARGQILSGDTIKKYNLTT